MQPALTDLHTHILPNIDDGAESLEAALQMLRKEKNDGVERVALTPHYYPLREELDAFLARRQQSYATLLTAWDGAVMPSLRLGAEVHYSPSLLQMDLRQLTIGGGDYLLLELADGGIPTHLEQVLDMMLMQGITPIFAHVERCEYFRREPEQLRKLIYMGALAQVSVRALKSRRDQNFSLSCLQSGLAQLVASDAHKAAGSRRPCMDAMEEILDSELLCRAEELAKTVWDNGPIPGFAVGSVKKGCFRYRV